MMPQIADVDLCLHLLVLEAGTMKADLRLSDLLLDMEPTAVPLMEDLMRTIPLLRTTTPRLRVIAVVPLLELGTSLDLTADTLTQEWERVTIGDDERNARPQEMAPEFKLAGGKSWFTKIAVWIWVGCRSRVVSFLVFLIVSLVLPKIAGISHTMPLCSFRVPF